MKDVRLTPHFRLSEFACRCGCGKKDISLQLVSLLEEIRQRVERPFIVLSGCRCERWNRIVGGVPDSAHLYGLAADIFVPDDRFRYEFLRHAVRYFPRIGIARKFIHVDIDHSKPVRVIWTYPVRK